MNARRLRLALVTVRGLRVASSLAVLGATAVAQLQFDALEKRHLPTGRDYISAVVACDVDADGDLDLVLGNLSLAGMGQTRLFLNDGDAVFTEATTTNLPVNSDVTTGIEAGDLDGDGDLDLFLASQNRTSQLFLNDGTGVFTDGSAGRVPALNDLISDVALGDVDGDGDLDVVLGSYLDPIFGFGGQSRLYLNDGTGTFTDATTTNLPLQFTPTTDVELADLDGDGDLDLVLANEYNNKWFFGRNDLYLNDGAGVFSLATAGRLPDDVNGSRAVAVGDVDADGDLDLVFGNQDRFGGAEKNRLYLNEGGGVFSDASATHLPPDPPADVTATLEFGDVDGDGDLDLVTGNYGQGANGQSRLYLNDGSGHFANVTSTSLPQELVQTLSSTLADLDGDLDLDLVLGAWGQPTRLDLNDGAGGFFSALVSSLPPDRELSRALAAGDVDADGDVDLLVGNVNATNRLYLNQGDGRFADGAARFPAVGGYTESVAVGDIEGDGDLDVVFGNLGPNFLFTNDGSGSFEDATSARLPVGPGRTRSLAFLDVEGDGDLDLFLGNLVYTASPQNRLLLNDGAGVFTDATPQLPVDADSTWAVAAGDVDGDGDPDLVLGNGNYGREQDRLYLNDGAGVFADAPANLPVRMDTTTALSLADVDADGDLDLLVVTNGNPTEQDRLYLNDGAGVFADVTSTQLLVPAINGSTVAAGDVDEDGDVDFALSRALYLNDGAGTFTEVSAARLVKRGAASCALADLDGDGDLDLASGVEFTENQVDFNLLRQTHAPFLAIPGHAYTVEVYARYGTPAPSLALPYWSPAPGSLPLGSFGTLLLDPTQLQALPPLLLPQPAGMANHTAVLPPDPGLVGLSLHVQSLVVPQPFSAARLTNRVVDVVRR